jgi:molybdopterin-binding protein
MALSARNQLRTSAEELDLKKGDAFRVVVKSTEVMIQKG